MNYPAARLRGISATLQMSDLEEKVAGFQVMLCSEKSRVIPYLSKALTAIILGLFSISLLVGLTVVGTSAFSLTNMPLFLFSSSALALFIGCTPLYLTHQFFSIKWGFGASVFAGIIGSLLAVMFSNISTPLWVCFPSAWGIKLMRTVLYGEIISGLGIIVVISLAMLILSLLWFQNWEGRKTGE